jgi:hypothetical protein
MKISDIDWSVKETMSETTDNEKLEELVEKWRDRVQKRNSVNAEWYAIGAAECADELEEIIE